jgi:hypothetical protein
VQRNSLADKEREELTLSKDIEEDPFSFLDAMGKAKDLIYEMLSTEKWACFSAGRHGDRQKYYTFPHNFIETENDNVVMWDLSSSYNKIYANTFDKSFKIFGEIEMGSNSVWLDLISLTFDLGYEERISLELMIMMKFC